MQRRAGKILEERLAQLPNYELRFNKKMRGGTGGADIQPSSGDTVYGVLYKIEESAFAAWIAMRAFPSTIGGSRCASRRFKLMAWPRHCRKALSRSQAQVYIASKIEKGLCPAQHDLQAMIEGATEHGLPESYTSEIRSARSLSAPARSE